MNTASNAGDDTRTDSTERLVNVFKRNRLSTVTGTARSNVDVSVQTQKYKLALDGVAESTKVALDILTALGEIHPFIKGPVIAFKIVLTLDLKRRENEVKVQAMKLEMENMMSVFAQLNEIPDAGNFRVDAALNDLMKDIEDAITDASSFVDYYLKKGLMRRCLKSAIYEIRFADHAQRFYDLGVRLHHALSIHTIWGIYSVKKSSEEISMQMSGIQAQLKDLFTLLGSTRERDVLSFIDSSGGARVCIESDPILHELIQRSGESVSERGLLQLRKSLREELSENIDKALQRHFMAFQGKLDIQLREINLAISRESRTIITALSGGHENIIDKDMRNIWRDMGWKSTVKARHFVFALRDYYHGGLHHRQEVPADVLPDSTYPSGLSTPPISLLSYTASETEVGPAKPADEDDAWALEYIHVSFLQPIAEAIDDDGSSFITSREVNRFTTMRPEGCSTLEWLAYWAAGWHSSVSQYVDKIYRLLRKFHRLREKVRHENLETIDYYLQHQAFSRIQHLLRSTNKTTDSIHPQLAALRDKFSQAEEDKLVESLEKLSFSLDSLATVKLVTGPHRIERYIYPLIYILLKSHLKIIHLARLHTINPYEFVDKRESLGFIFEAFDLRLEELSAVFRQMNIDPKSHLEHYAFRMFQTSCGRTMWREQDSTTRDAWNNLAVVAGEDDDLETCPQDLSTDLLRYKPRHFFEFHEAPFKFSDRVDHDCDSGFIHGLWSVTLYEDYSKNGDYSDNGDSIDNIDDNNITPFDGIMEIDLGSESADGKLSGTGYNWFSDHKIIYAIRDSEGDSKDVDILILYDTAFWVRCIGTFSPSASRISGRWYRCTSVEEPPPQDIGAAFDDPRYHIDIGRYGSFVLSRTPESLAGFRYAPQAFAQNAVKARWDFARKAVRFIVRRDRMEKNLVISRLKDARRLVELELKLLITDQTTMDENTEKYALEVRLSLATATFWYEVAVFLYNSLKLHNDVTCDGPCCSVQAKAIFRTRYVCIVCMDASFSETLDFCAECRDTTSISRYPSHTTSHSLIRLHVELYDFDQFELVRKAREISRQIKEKFRRVQDIPVCGICSEQISLPCWACIECFPDRLVCNKCDLEHQAMPSIYKMVRLSTSQFTKKHGFHAMVWIRDDKEVNIMPEKEKDVLTRLEDRVGNLIETRLAKELYGDIGPRLGTVEERLSALESRFDSFERRFDSVEERFVSLETLIRTLMSNQSWRSSEVEVVSPRAK